MAKAPGIDRRESIRAAAIELFARQGFQSTPTTQVAKLAGVSEGTIFYHFQTKEGILLSLYEEIMGEFIDSLAEAQQKASNGLEAVLACLMVQVNLCKQRQQESHILARDLPSGFYDTSLSPASKVLAGMENMISLIRQAIERGREDGSIGECDPERTSRLVMAIMIGMSRMFRMEHTALDQLNKDMIEFCRKALAAGPSSGPQVVNTAGS